MAVFPRRACRHCRRRWSTNGLVFALVYVCAQHSRGEYDIVFMSLRRLPFWRRWRLGRQPPLFGGLRQGMAAAATAGQELSGPPLHNQGLVQVAYSDPASRLFLGSPSIARLADGTLLISHVSSASWSVPKLLPIGQVQNAKAWLTPRRASLDKSSPPPTYPAGPLWGAAGGTAQALRAVVLQGWRG